MTDTNLVPVTPAQPPQPAPVPVKHSAPRGPGKYQVHYELDGQKIKATFDDASRRDAEFRRIEKLGIKPQAFNVEAAPAQENESA